MAGELAPLKLAHAKFRVTLNRWAMMRPAQVAWSASRLKSPPWKARLRIAGQDRFRRRVGALFAGVESGAGPSVAAGGHWCSTKWIAGVGGAVADAVGERLQRLGQTTQVLLVTHSPQVAARAERHFRITRVGDKTAGRHAE